MRLGQPEFVASEWWQANDAERTITKDLFACHHSSAIRWGSVLVYFSPLKDLYEKPKIAV